MSAKNARALVPSHQAPEVLQESTAGTPPPPVVSNENVPSAPEKVFAVPPERDDYTTTALADVLNRATHASLAKLTLGLSPASLMTAYFDWLIHLLAAPGKQLQLTEKAVRKLIRLQQFMITCAASQGRARAASNRYRKIDDLGLMTGKTGRSMSSIRRIC